MRVELNTKIVRVTETAWVVFPGQRRRFFEEFENHERLFLELPNFGYGAITQDGRQPSDNELVRRIRRAVEFRVYLDELAVGKEYPRPSDDLDRYSTDSNDGQVNTMLGCVKNLFQRIEPGELVVVPGPQGAYGPVLFGEVQGEFSARDRLQIGRFGEYSLDARRVKWIKKLEQRRELPAQLAKHLERPPSVHRIKRTLENDQIFGAAYDSYVSHLTAEAIVRAPEYNGHSPTQTLPLQNLNAIIAAVYFASQSDISSEEFARLNLTEIVSRFLPTDAFLEYQFAFASPGYLRARTRNAALALAMSAGFTFAAGGLSGCTPAEDIYVTNEKGELPQDTQEAVNRMLDFMKTTMSEGQKREIEQLAHQSVQELDAYTASEIVDE